MIGLLIGLGAFILWLAIVWILANFGFVWTFCPANCFGLVVARGNEKENEAGISGAEAVDMIHGVPGRKWQKHDPGTGERYLSLLDWELVPGEEKRGLLYHLLKVHYIGPMNKVKEIQIHELRFGKKKDDSGEVKKDPKVGTRYSVESKDYKTKFVYYSREQAIDVENADTKGLFELDVQLNTLYRVDKPGMYMLAVANPNAVLTTMGEEAVNNITGGHEAEYFVEGDEGKSSEDAKAELVNAVKAIKDRAREVIGIEIYEVNVRHLDFDEETRKLLELKKRTEREQAAATEVEWAEAERRMIKGLSEKEYKLRHVEADKQRVADVILPIAITPGGPAVRGWEAYERNTTVTSFVVGGELASLLLNPNQPPPTPKVQSNPVQELPASS